MQSKSKLKETGQRSLTTHIHVRRPCSDSSHVTAPYKLSFYYYYYYYYYYTTAFSQHK